MLLRRRRRRQTKGLTIRAPSPPSLVWLRPTAACPRVHMKREGGAGGRQGGQHSSKRSGVVTGDWTASSPCLPIRPPVPPAAAAAAPLCSSLLHAGQPPGLHFVSEQNKQEWIRPCRPRHHSSGEQPAAAAPSDDDDDDETTPSIASLNKNRSRTQHLELSIWTRAHTAHTLHTHSGTQV